MDVCKTDVVEVLKAFWSRQKDFTLSTKLRSDSLFSRNRGLKGKHEVSLWSHIWAKLSEQKQFDDELMSDRTTLRKLEHVNMSL